MGHTSKEPLFTPKELLLVASLWVFYAVAIFSMGPEWVAWAAPVAFGGALTAAAPQPTPEFSAPPGEFFAAASYLSVLSLAALSVLAALRGERGLGLFARLTESIQAVRRSRFAHSFLHIMPRWKPDARALLPSRRGSSIGQENWGHHPAAPAQGHVTTASQRSRIVPRGL